MTQPPRVPDGMVELWTIERPADDGVLIDDLKQTEREARAEVERRGWPWSTTRIVVPYGGEPKG
jgi:hypothetical protein